jgi:predicted ATPase
MITLIEIDGFKTFKDFKVELAPFQVIVGPNGSGKSNLFDALLLLSLLAETNLLTAFQKMRGNAGELFTRLPTGKSVDRMRIAVEMLVDRKVKDDLGREVELKYTRLRYELEITPGTDEYGLEQLYITHESLKTIPRTIDDWSKRYQLDLGNSWLAKGSDSEFTFFSFTQEDAEQAAILSLHYLPLDKHEEGQAQVMDEAHSFPLAGLTRTVLSSSTVALMHHALAAREELRSLKFLHLNPEALRRPSSINTPRFLLPDGHNLPAALVRIQAEDKLAFHWISMEMASLVPDILKIEVEKDQARDEYFIQAKTSDQLTFSSQVLSDGTLRLLALATLRYDPEFHGVLCLEELENGVDPLHLGKMARLLREMATDFNDPEQADEPLRQVIATTHSPAFISQPDVVDSLLLALMPTRVQGKTAPSLRVTRMVPVITPNTLSQLKTDKNGDKAVETYTINQVKKYLDSDTLDEAYEQLEKARIVLNER